jgi:hypothetical protein
VHHTLLECSEFDDLREEMWTGKRETDLLTLLDTPELAAKVSKYLLATGELLQFRHLNEAQASDDYDVDPPREALMEDGW